MKKRNFTFLLGFIAVIPTLSLANAELPSAKLRCSGYVWVDGQRYDLSDGFIDLNKNTAVVRGFGIPDGNYEVIPKSVREDFLAIKNTVRPLLLGGINRLSGKSNFIENAPSGEVRDGKMLFLGECVKAKSLF